MGFKDNASFLRFLTIGALGVRQTIAELARMGFQPIELERYCTSNKIWGTKIKRLRLPDLICVRTGLPVEVRAKSVLAIKMSDAPTNPSRAWYAGLRDEDVVAFIACQAGGTSIRPADEAAFFTVKSLRDSVGGSRLGPAKSASEGSERDREWPAIIPARDASVEQVLGGSFSNGKLRVVVRGEGGVARRQTYRLQGRHAYVHVGESFRGGISIIAGLPAGLARLNDYLLRTYDPLGDLAATSDVDRYSAAKVIRSSADLATRAIERLRARVLEEEDGRIALEAAGTAAAIGRAFVERYIRACLSSGSADLQMEAILILSELRTPFALRELKRVAADRSLDGRELRQAAIWGLVKKGHRSY